MTVGPQSTNIDYRKLESNTDYQFNFTYLDDAHIQVTAMAFREMAIDGILKNVKLQVVLSDVLYTTERIGKGGVVVIPSNDAVDVYFRQKLSEKYPGEDFSYTTFEYVNIQRNMPYAQTVKQYQGYSGPRTENADDLSVMLTQQLDGRLIRLEDPLTETSISTVGSSTVDKDYIPVATGEGYTFVNSCLHQGTDLLTCTFNVNFVGDLFNAGDLNLGGYLVQEGHYFKIRLNGAETGDLLSLVNEEDGFFSIVNIPNLEPPDYPEVTINYIPKAMADGQYTESIMMEEDGRIMFNGDANIIGNMTLSGTFTAGGATFFYRFTDIQDGQVLSIVDRDGHWEIINDPLASSPGARVAPNFIAKADDEGHLISSTFSENLDTQVVSCAMHAAFNGNIDVYGDMAVVGRAIFGGETIINDDLGLNGYLVTEGIRLKFSFVDIKDGQLLSLKVQSGYYEIHNITSSAAGGVTSEVTPNYIAKAEGGGNFIDSSLSETDVLLTCTLKAYFQQDLDVGGDLVVSGPTLLNSELTVNELVTFNDDIDIRGMFISDGVKFKYAFVNIEDGDVLSLTPKTGYYEINNKANEITGNVTSGKLAKVNDSGVLVDSSLSETSSELSIAFTTIFAQNVELRKDLLLDGMLNNGGVKLKFNLTSIADGQLLALYSQSGYYDIRNVPPSSGGGGVISQVTDGRIAKANDSGILVNSSLSEDTTTLTCSKTGHFGSDFNIDGNLKFIGTLENGGVRLKFNLTSITDGDLLSLRSEGGYYEINNVNSGSPSAPASAQYDESGILSGFTAVYGDTSLTIAEGTCVVWDGTSYKKFTTSSPIVLSPTLYEPFYVLLRSDGSGGIEAYTTTSRPSNAVKVRDAILFYVTVFDSKIDEVSNRFRNLNQQLEQVIDVIGLTVPYSTIGITLDYGDTSLVREAGKFTDFGVRDIPTTADKYNTSHINLIQDNNPFFDVMDVDEMYLSSHANDFPLPAQWNNAGLIQPIPANSWGYYLVLITAHGRLKFVYPNAVFVSDSVSSEDAQEAIRDLEVLHNFRDDGFAVIGILGLKGGVSTFETETSKYYKHVYQLGGGSNVVTSLLPDANEYNIGDVLTVVESEPGLKEWEGQPDKIQSSVTGYEAFYDTENSIAGRASRIKTSFLGYEAYYDTTGTISGRESRIKTGTPGHYAIYDSTGLALEGVTGPTSRVKTGTMGKPAYYDSASSISSSTGHIVPNPTASDAGKFLRANSADVIGWVAAPTSSVKSATIGQLAAYDTTTTVHGISGKAVPSPTASDVGKILSATAEGVVGWIEEAEAPTSPVKVSTIGQVAIYDTIDTVHGTSDKLAPNPTNEDVGKVLGATSAGVVGWVNQSSGGNITIDNTFVRKFTEASQSPGDIVASLSKERIFNSGVRLYDNHSHREILALNGQAVSLKQYLGLGYKTDLDIITDPVPAQEDIPQPIQGKSSEYSGYRLVRFFKAPTNSKYALEITASTYNSTSGITVKLCTVNVTTGVLTPLHTHTTWAGTSTIEQPSRFGIFFVADDQYNYYGYNIRTSLSGNYRVYFYQLDTGAPIGSAITTNKWNFPDYFDYGIYNNYLYVFYQDYSSMLSFFDKVSIRNNTLTFLIDGQTFPNSTNNRYWHKARPIDSDTLLIWYVHYASMLYYVHHRIFTLSTDQMSDEYTGTNGISGLKRTQGGIVGDGKFKFSCSGTDGTLTLNVGQFTIGVEGGTSTDTILPGGSFACSYYDQHPKYTNVCAYLKNNASQLYLSFDYGNTWIEKEGFFDNIDFKPHAPAGTTTNNYDISTSIWLDGNNTNMIFTGWLSDAGGTAPFAIQDLKSQSGMAKLPNWYKGAYLVSTEFQYLPITWFDNGEGSYIGQTYHEDNMKLAKSIGTEGVIKDIQWAAGTTKPHPLHGLACSLEDNAVWAISYNAVYLSNDNISFHLIYEAPDGEIINNLYRYDKSSCIITTYKPSPFNSTTISLINKEGGRLMIYHTTNPDYILSDLAVSDNYIVASRKGLTQVLWANRSDLIFVSVNTGSEIKKVAVSNTFTYGLGIDGLTLFTWTGKGLSESTLRTFTGITDITDMDAGEQRLYAVGRKGLDGVSYVYDGSFWKEHTITSNQLFSIGLKRSANLYDYIAIGGATAIYISNDGLDTAPIPLTITSGSISAPTNHIAVYSAGGITWIYGIGDTGYGYSYTSGDPNTSIITDFIESTSSGVIIGTSPMGYIVRKDPNDDYWTRKQSLLSSGIGYGQRQSLAYGGGGVFYLQDDSGKVGVSTDGGKNFTVRRASSNQPAVGRGGFVGDLNGGVSLLALENCVIAKSVDDWQTEITFNPFPASTDLACTCFTRDVSRKYFVYAAMSQISTGDNFCIIARFSDVTNWTQPSILLEKTLTGGRHFTYVASYNNRLIVTVSDGGYFYSLDAGVTWSQERRELVADPVVDNGITSLWIENGTDCVYIAKQGGIVYNTFEGIVNSDDWIIEDVPVSENQNIGGHIINGKRTLGVVGNIGVNLYWRKYDQ